MSEHLVKQLLLSNAYWVLNKEIVKEVGVEPALILGVFAEAEKELTDENGWFYQTSTTIEKLTGMSNHKQSQAINKLIKIGVLLQENRGVPCKRYFKISYEEIEKSVFKKIESQFSKNLKTSIQNSSILYNKEYNINKIYKENNKENNKENVMNILFDKLNSENISEVLQQKIKEFIEYRKEINKPIKTYRSIKTLINQIGNKFVNEQHLIDSIDDSIANEYQGVFPTKIFNNKTNKENITSSPSRRRL